MTLTTSLLEKTRCLIVTDTLAFGGGLPCQATKILALPAQKCAAVVQGDHSMLCYLFEHSMMFADMDDALRVMPVLLDGASEALSLEPTDVNIGTNLHLFGYSRQRGAMVHVIWKTRDGKTWTDEVSSVQKPRLNAAPAAREAWDGTMPHDAATLMAFVRRQAKLAQARGLDVGGRAIITTIDRHGIQMSEGGDLGLPAVMGKHAADERVTMRLQEDDPGVWDTADAATSDPTPNTRLPNPWQVVPITGLAATSSDSTALKSNLGVITPRVSLTWDAVTSRYVLEGGHIRVRWRYGSEPWREQREPADAISAYIIGPKHDDRIVVEVAAVNGLGKDGPPAFLAHTVDGPTSIGTVQAEANMATVAQFQNATTPATQDSSGGAGFPRYLTLTDMSWTNDTGAAVDMQMEASGSHYFTGGGSACFIDFEYLVNGTPTYLSQSPLATTTDTIYSKVAQYNLAAGSTIEFRVRSNIGNFVTATSTHTCNSFVGRLTALKR